MINRSRSRTPTDRFDNNTPLLRRCAPFRHKEKLLRRINTGGSRTQTVNNLMHSPAVRVMSCRFGRGDTDPENICFENRDRIHSVRARPFYFAIFSSGTQRPRGHDLL